MRTLSATELLSLWERGLAQSPVQRGRLLLDAVAETPGAGGSSCSIGRAEARLLELRERLFGPEMAALAECPACGERVELQFRTDAVRAPALEGEAPENLQIEVAGYEVVFRLPTALDLERLDPRAEPAGNRRSLLVDCVLSARKEEAPIAAGDLPEEIVTAIAQRMAEADPQADIRLDLHCPHCAHQWLAPLDVASFLWSELHAWAQRALHEVHALACAYGWREADILALSPWRRQTYLALLAT